MNKKQLTKFISLVLALVLSVSAAVGVFASETTNDDYGTYEDGISSAHVRGTRAYEKPAIKTDPETNPFSLASGLMYWGPINDSLSSDNSVYTKASDVADVVTDESGEKYLQVGKDNTAGGIYTVKVKLPDAANGKKIALFCQTKATGQPAANNIYGSVELYVRNSDEQKNAKLIGSRVNIKTDQWCEIDSSVNTSGEYESSDYDCISVQINNNENAVVYVKDIVVAYANNDGSYTSIYDSNLLYNNATKQPYYGTVKDGIACKQAKDSRIYELNAIDATKINPYSLENGLMYWGATSGLTSNAYTKASDVAGVVQDADTGERYLQVGKNTNDTSHYVKTVRVKLPDAAKGKNLALFCQTKAEGTPTNTIYGSVELHIAKSDSEDDSKRLGSQYNIKTDYWNVIDVDASGEYDSSNYDCISVQIMNNANAIVYVKNIVVAYANDDGTYTSIFDSNNVYNYATKQPYYGTVKDGIACKQAKDSRIYELNAIDATKINPYSLENGLMYWGATSGLTNNAYTKASDVASVVKDDKTGETYLQVGKEGTGNKACTVNAVKVKLPDAAKGRKLALFFQIKGEGTPKPINASVNQYGTVKFMYGNSQNKEGFKYFSNEQKIKLTNWTVGDTSLVTSSVWDDNSQYDCVSVEIQNVYESDYSTVVYIKDIVIAYANDDGSYTSIFDSSVVYDGEKKLPYYGTQAGGISSAREKGTRAYEKPAIATEPETNPFSLASGLMYWGPITDSLNSDKSIYTSASEVAGIVTDVTTGEKYLQVGKDNIAGGIYTVKVKLPDAANGKKIALFCQTKAEGTSTNTIYGSVELYKGSSSDSDVSKLVNATYNIKTTEWGVEAVDMITSNVWEKDTSDYDCISVQIKNNANAVVYVKDIVVAYDNGDGTYTSIYDSDNVYNGYTKRSYYGNALYGMYTEAAANKKIDNMTIATDTLMNGDFSQGLRYWAPRESQSGYASQYATVSDNVLTLSTEEQYGGVTTCFVKIPNTALNKKVVGLFEYKTGESYNSQASRVVKLITSATDATHEATNDNGQFKLTNTTEYTQGSTKYVTFATEGSTVRLEIHNGYCPASMKNFALAYIDEIGIPNKALYANLDGTLYGGFAEGDANADYAVNVGDLVRMVRYSDNNECGIYYTAIKLDNSSESNIGEAEIDALLDRLLEME